MIPELGHFALCAALAVALLQTALPAIGARGGADAFLTRLAGPATGAHAVLVLFAFCCLSYAFVVNDFSVRYVATNSNRLLPLPYKLSAVWGAHEGSLLLWSLMLALWSVAVARFSRGLPPRFRARVLSVMGAVAVGFLLFMVLTSNPFERLLPAPADGRDLNPLLQDPGLIIHPPMLYMGYVGFAVAFAFAIAALLEGRLDRDWARWSRPWTLAAWVFLTIGITLGSWWAYHELGWGGWWFWDPVENASFMPWLVGTALIHSLIVSERRDAFKSWTALLAITAFSLSLLGAFLVRSGVLISVHAFASDPARGFYILLFLLATVGSSLLLYAWRAPGIKSGGVFAPLSREGALLVNNVLLLSCAACILIATLYPLLMDALSLGKISVGPPYFAAVFVPLALPLALVAAVGPRLPWRRATAAALAGPAAAALPAAAAAVTLGAIWADDLRWTTIPGLAAGGWVLGATAHGLALRLREARGARALPASFWGMTVAHFGIGVFVLGVTANAAFSEEREIVLGDGQGVELAGHRFVFEGVGEHPGPNYMARRGRVVVFDAQDREIATLHPEKRIYTVQANAMTEAAIDAGALRDLYVALGEPVDGRWGLRVYYRPLVRWIWFGAFLMALGGALAACDRRYRRGARPAPETDDAAPGAAGARSASPTTGAPAGAAARTAARMPAPGPGAEPA